MIADYGAVREVATRIGAGVDFAVAALREGRVEQEPAMTDRMLGAIEHSIDGFESKGIRWSAKTLTDRGGDSQEHAYGADFVGVLNLDLPQLKVSKGFLAQAKLVRHGAISDIKGLGDQCKKMLALSPDSFVFLYDKDGVRVVPAVSVVGASVSPLKLYHRSARAFFEAHLECFIGDRDINAPSPAALSGLRDRLATRSALLLQGQFVGFSNR